jgi:quercetin dioxygenase-like cupin family protein
MSATSIRSMRKGSSMRILRNAAVTLVTLTGLTIAASLPADDSQAKRTILERHDQSAGTGKEIVIGTADLPAGTSIGWHTHPGDEAGYIVRGTLVLKTRGQPDRVLKAGDSFFNPRGAVHSVATAPGGEGALAASTWIIDKGKPLAEPASP